MNIYAILASLSSAGVPADVLSSIEAAAFRLALSAMTVDQAKAVLGLSSAGDPSSDEVKKAWQKMALKHHPDVGGDPQKMVEVNVARDILTGERRADRGGSSPAPQPSSPPASYTARPPRPDVVVTLKEALQKAVVPNDVDWKFRTTSQRGTSYSGDEFSRSESWWVAVGTKDSRLVVVTAEHKTAEGHYSGGDRKDVWSADFDVFPGPMSDKVVRLVTEALRKAGAAKRFDGKVIPLPPGTALEDTDKTTFRSSANVVSLKAWLAEQGLMKPEDARPKKDVIEIVYHKAYDEKPGHYKLPGAYDFEAVDLVLNGKAERLSKHDLGVARKMIKTIYGEYTYGGDTKVLTRMPKGPALMALMLQHMTDLSPELREGLTRVVESKK